MKTAIHDISMRIFAIMLAAAMTVTMMPYLGGAAGVVYASESVPGGTVASNNEDALRSALGGGSVVQIGKSTTGGKTVITAKLKNDVVLSSPLTITQGDAGDKVVIDLDGHTMSGAAGTDGGDDDAAAGKSAVEIEAGAFDVVIKGPGSVIGGKGAVVETDTNFRAGYYGGDAVRFINSSYYPTGLDAPLSYGLTVTGGAALTGGAGGDISSEDWLYDIENYNGDRTNHPYFAAGSGGAGIGQEEAGRLYNNSLSYAKIIVENGTVTGGAGGTADMSAITPTTYALMTSRAAAAVMSGKTAEQYTYTMVSFPPFAGRGGDGMRIGGGRKYINIGSNGTVRGSSCGSVDFGDHKTFSLMGGSFSTGDYGRSNYFQAGNAGDGIAVWDGDLGLTAAVPGFTGNDWQSRTAESDDMGLYVAGSVTGGSTPDTDSVGQSAGKAGAGIALYGDHDRFGIKDNSEYHGEWGIVDIEGTVTGGNGGSALSGNGGNGGYGIYEDYSVEYNDDGTNHYIIKGTVNGGNGGSSFAATDLSDAGLFGSGGNGMAFMDSSREGLFVAGNGHVIAGDAGDTSDRGSGSSTIADSGVSAIYLNPLTEPGYYNNTVTVNRTDGGGAGAAAVSKINVSASMTGFSTYPDTSTRVSCTVDKPSGYTGNVYVKWFAEIRLQSNDPVVCGIEPSGNDPMSFNMLSNADYKYLAYPKAASYDLKNVYNYSLSTTDRIRDTLEYNGSKCKIYCYVLLEDGSWGKSNVMEFDRNGWQGGSGGGGSGEDQDDQAEIDQAAADAVMAMIDGLPLLANITLDDEEAVNAARAAYEALTAAQKELLRPYTYLLDDLGRAEAKIRELKGDADKVQEVIDMIDGLADAGEITSENAEAESAKIEAIREAVAGLSDEQQQLLAQETEALAKLAAVDEAVNAALGTEGHVHLMCHVPEKAATCTTEGNIGYYYCLICDDGNLYADADGAYEITEPVETDIDESAHVMRQVTGIAATCRSKGMKGHFKCMACGKTFEDEDGLTEILDISALEIPADPNAHAWRNGAGNTAYYLDSYTITRTDTCTVCGTSRTVTVGNANYAMNLPAVKIAKGKAAKKKFTAKWKKVSKKNQKKIGGIEIQVTGPGFDKVYTAGKGKASKSIKVPKGKTSYKYRVRAYKGSGTGKQVSKWSGWKKVKVK